MSWFLANSELVIDPILPGPLIGLIGAALAVATWWYYRKLGSNFRARATSRSCSFVWRAWPRFYSCCSSLPEKNKFRLQSPSGSRWWRWTPPAV